jgi:hypothetical protein
VLAVVAVHEGRHHHRAVRLAQLVLDRAAHAEHLGVEVVGGLDVVLAQDAVAEALVAGHEAAEHRPAGVERPEGHHFGTVENLGRVAARVGELQQPQHAALVALGAARPAVRHLGGFELGGHFFELVRARHAPADVGQVVLGALVQHEAVVPVVQAQILAIALAGVVQLHADDFGGKALPRRHVGDVEAHVTEFRDLDHCYLPAGDDAPQPRAAGWCRITPLAVRRSLTHVRPGARCTRRARFAYPADRPFGHPPGAAATNTQPHPGETRP